MMVTFAIMAFCPNTLEPRAGKSTLFWNQSNCFSTIEKTHVIPIFSTLQHHHHCTYTVWCKIHKLTFLQNFRFFIFRTKSCNSCQNVNSYEIRDFPTNSRMFVGKSWNSEILHKSKNLMGKYVILFWEVAILQKLILCNKKIEIENRKLRCLMFPVF